MTYFSGMAAITPVLDRIRAKQTTVLVALGDSNTCNASFTAGGKQWPELLHSELRIHLASQRVLMVNAGICGDTALGAHHRLESDVLQFRPSLTFVTFGSNDIGQYSPAVFRDHLDHLVDHILESGSMVVLRTSPPVMERLPSPAHIWRANPKEDAAMDQVRSLAAGRGLPLVDHYAWWGALEQAGELQIGPLMHDEVHPNAPGHQLLARQMCVAMGMPGPLHWERGATEVPGA